MNVYQYSHYGIEKLPRNLTMEPPNAFLSHTHIHAYLHPYAHTHTPLKSNIVK